MCCRNLGERLAHLYLGFGRRTPKSPYFLASLLSILDHLWCLELATPEHAPRNQSHAEHTRHRYDVALEVSQQHVPPALIDAKLGLPVVSGVHVGGTDDPSRRVRDPQV